jgi:hypothetical protein
MWSFDLNVLLSQNTESCIIDSPTETAWQKIRNLDFAKLFPKTVTSCNLLVPETETTKMLDVPSPKSASASGDFSFLETKYKKVSIKTTAQSQQKPAFDLMFMVPTAVGELITKNLFL